MSCLPHFIDACLETKQANRVKPRVLVRALGRTAKCIHILLSLNYSGGRGMQWFQNQAVFLKQEVLNFLSAHKSPWPDAITHLSICLTEQ